MFPVDAGIGRKVLFEFFSLLFHLQFSNIALKIKKQKNLISAMEWERESESQPEWLRESIRTG